MTNEEAKIWAKVSGALREVSQGQAVIRGAKCPLCCQEGNRGFDIMDIRMSRPSKGGSEYIYSSSRKRITRIHILSEHLEKRSVKM